MKVDFFIANPTSGREEQLSRLFGGNKQMINQSIVNYVAIDDESLYNQY